MKKELTLATIIVAAVFLSPIALSAPAYAAKTVVCTAGDGCGVEDDSCSCSYQLAMKLPLPKDTTLTISSENQTSLVEELTTQLRLHPSETVKMQVISMLDQSNQSRLPINDTTVLNELSK